MEQVMPYVKPTVGFNIFGSQGYRDCVLCAIHDEVIELKQKTGPDSYCYIDVKGQDFGRAWIDNESSEAIVAVVEGSDPKDEMLFPWKFRHPKTFIFQFKEGETKKGLPAFVTFAKFMERFLVDLTILFKTQVSSIKREFSIPEGLESLLEFAFFKQFSPTLQSIEFAVAFTKGTLGFYAYVMAVVTDEEDPEPLRICSFVKLDSGK